MNILFYSNRCEHSTKLIKILNENNLLKNFNMILVDNNKKIPKYIKKVPTLIIKDINIPLEGNAAFNWVKTITKFDQVTNNIKLVKKKVGKILIDRNNFKGINQNETKSISDNYAFIEDKDIIKNNISYLKNNYNKKIINDSKNKEKNINLKKHIKIREKQNIDFSKLNF